MRAAVVVMILGAAALGGCGKGAPAGGQAGSVAGAQDSGCSSYKAGVDGVIRTFCDGPGAVTLTYGGKSRTLKGGACEQSGPMFAFNAGVVTGIGAKAPYPDYVGLTTQGMGAFSNAILPIHIDGKAYRVTPNSGQAGAKGGSFSGTAHPTDGGPDIDVNGTFTC
jgi:hypothetical protein